MPQRVILSANALFQELDGEGVILDLDSSSYFGVDGVGVRLWELLQNNPDLDAAIECLAAEYEVSREQLNNDIRSFVNDLVETGLAVLE